jgi:Ca2+-binding RTX toxin-like protein
MVLIALFTMSPVVSASSGSGVTCSFDEGTHTVTVTIDQVFFFGGLTNANAEIRLTAGSLPAMDCGASTMTNTDTVIINDVTTPPGPGGGREAASIHILPEGGPWAPGFTDEPGASDEIEFVISLGTQGPLLGTEGDTVEFEGSASEVASTVVLGGAEINLNADEIDGVDADVVLDGVEAFVFRGNRFSDSVTGSGGAGTPRVPYEGEILASGKGGSDAFEGGSRGVSFFGNKGNDGLLGGAGDDFLAGGSGKDVIRGGPGHDGLIGGHGSDLIVGGSGRDTGWGAAGSDRLRGQADPDDLLGGPDDDRLDGGPGRDGCNGGAGTNALKRCERETRL